MVRWAENRDMPRIRALWKQRFGDSESFLDFFFTRRAKPEYAVVYDEGGVLSSALHVYPAACNLRGKRVRGAMLCGVCTDKAFEGRGRMGACLAFALSELAKTDCAFVIQKPVDFAIYKSYGFRAVNDAFTYTVSGDKKALDETILTDPQEHLTALLRVYNAFTLPHSTASWRDEEEFSVKALDYLADGGECRTLTDDEGGINAYCFFEHDGDSIIVRELGWTDEKAGERLFSSLSAISAERRLPVCGRVPAHERSVLDRIPSCTAEEIKPWAAASVSNVPLLLKTAFEGTELVFAVTDEKIPARQGIWNTRGEVTDKAPDLQITSSALIRLAFGYARLCELILEGQVKILNREALAGFDTRFPAPPAYSWDEY